MFFFLNAMAAFSVPLSSWAQPLQEQRGQAPQSKAAHIALQNQIRRIGISLNGILPSKDRYRIPALLKDLFRATSHLTRDQWTNENILKAYAQVDASAFVDEIDKIIKAYNGIQNIQPQGFRDTVQHIQTSRTMAYLDFLKIAYAYSANSSHNHQRGNAITNWNDPRQWSSYHHDITLVFPEIVLIPTFHISSYQEYLKYSAFGIFPIQLMERFQHRKVDNVPTPYDNLEVLVHDVEDHAGDLKKLRQTRVNFMTLEERSIELVQTRALWNEVASYKRTKKLSNQESDILDAWLFWLTHERHVFFTKVQIQENIWKVSAFRSEMLTFVRDNVSARLSEEQISNVWSNFCKHAGIRFNHQ